MRLFGDDMDITDGIDHNVWQAIDKSIDNNSIETFRTLKSFVRHVLQLSVRNKSLKHFQKYIFFPATFYTVSYRKAKEKQELTNIHQYCSQQAAIHLKEIILYDISFSARRKGAEEKKTINQFYYWAFNGFSRLLYYIIQNNDVAQFKFAIEEFEQISDSEYGRYHELKWELKNLKRENIDGSKQEIIKHKEDEYKITKAFDDYKRHVLIGIRYWIFFLYRVNKIKEDVASSFLEKIRVPYIESEDLLSDVLFFRSGDMTFYMGWEDWDFVERHSGKVYSPPQPYDWLTFGFMADQIREKRLYINVKELSSQEIDQAKYIVDDLKKNGEYFEKNFEKWKKLLNKPSVEDLRKTSSAIIKDFAMLKRESITATDRAIALAPLSPARIDSFKEVMGKAWKNQARIHRMFRAFGNSEDVTTQEIKLKNIGQRTFFERGKMMFTEENYQPIYGIDQMGGQVGRWEDNHFFSTILQGDYNKANAASIVNLLDEGIKQLQEKGFQPDLILMAPEYSYKDDDLIKSKKFERRIQFAQHGVEISHFSIGKFDEIEVYTSFSDFLNNRILICNFQQAFQMMYKTNQEWFEGELTVKVNPVTKEIAEKKLNENREKWTKLDDEQILDDPEALLLIMTSVMIDIWTTIDFKVLNKDAYIIGNIKAEDTPTS